MVTNWGLHIAAELPLNRRGVQTNLQVNGARTLGYKSMRVCESASKNFHCDSDTNPGEEPGEDPLLENSMLAKLAVYLLRDRIRQLRSAGEISHNTPILITTIS